jgi:hypothetical protein
MNLARLWCVPVATMIAASAAAPRALPAQLPAPVTTDQSRPARCGAGIPEGGTHGYIPLPRGDVFCPLIADPKGMNSSVSYLRGDAEEFASNVASIGIADVFGLFRNAGSSPGNGVQLSISGGVFAQFDLGAPSYDLINADYLIGIPLTVRSNNFSARLRVYHQSSHLGDEFLLRTNHPDRENLSFEALELILSQDIGPLRVYGGGEYYLARDPSGLPSGLGHGGLELRPPGSVTFGTVSTVRIIAAVDVKTVRQNDQWMSGVSARAGFEIGRGKEGPVPSRRWSLLYEFYDGPSPYGQFFQNDIRLMGIGLHFTP